MRFILWLALMISVPAIAQKKVTVSGYVQDAQSSETLLGAIIQNRMSNVGTTTNSFGFYTITMPAGQVKLRCSYVGYDGEELNLQLDRDTVINFRLRQSTELSEVVVVSKNNAGIQATGMGVIDIPVTQISHTPSLLGETDVIRTLQMLPGVQTGMDGMAGFYVRGGNADENLILLDGTPIYKVDHMYGFFSVFTPEALKKVTFYKSSYPARYNGRLSSVVDVRTKDGDMRRFHGTASIGLLTSRVQFEGPIIKDRTSFNFSGRTTYVKWLAQPFMEKDDKYGYQFYDLNLKINHRFSDKDRLYLSAYRGRDVMDQDTKDYPNRFGVDVGWGNTIASLRWNHIFGNRLFANTTVAYNNYDMDLYSFDHSTWDSGNFENIDVTYGSSIKDWSAAIDFDYEPIPQHSIKFGGSYTYHTFVPEVVGSNYQKKGMYEEPTKETFLLPKRPIYANDALIYAEDDWKIGDALTMNIGGSMAMFRVRRKTYVSFQPRVSVRWQMLNDVALKASYSEMSQCFHLLTSMPISMPTDLWVPITENIKPERSRQLSVGAYYTGWKGWEISLEAYTKKLTNVLEYKDGMGFMGFSGNWERLVSMGEGRSMGLEFMLHRTVGRVTGWLAYTLSKSDRQFSKESGVNGGERFPFTYDRRHNLNLVFNWKAGKNFDLDATWAYYSGVAATIALEQGYIVTPEGSKIADYVSNRNNYRLPPTHLLCLGANFRKILKRGIERTWNISIYNAYNAMNPTLVIKKDKVGTGQQYPKLNKITILPIIPSFTVTYKF